MSLAQKGEFIDDLMPIAYFKDNNRVLLRQKSEMFFWYDVEKEQLRQVSVEVNLDADGDEHDWGYTFTYQVIPASLARLKKSDCTNGGVDVEGKLSKRKRTCF